MTRTSRSLSKALARFAYGCAFGLPIACAASLVAGNSMVLPAAVSLVFLLIGFAALKTQTTLQKDLLAICAVGQPIAITTAFSGHLWQIDSHMIFFAVVATVVALNNVRALISATLVVAVHHVSLSVLMPALVYPDGEVVQNVARSLFHGAVLALETGALIVIVRSRKRLVTTMIKERDSANAAKASAQAETERAEASARDAQAQREAAQTLAEDARKAREDAEADAKRIAKLSEDIKVTTADATAQQNKLRIELQEVVDALSDAMLSLSEGDLTADLSRKLPDAYCDVANTFNAAVANMNNMISDIKQNAEVVRDEAHSISSATEDLTRRAETQVTALMQSTDALGELTADIKQASAAAKKAVEISQDAKRNVETGRDVVAKAATAIERIEATSKDIGNITSVIDSISFQTNLLALNAGVEAARAGEAGRGFAVVASEVRSLAQRSSEAAQEIRNLIGKSSEEVRAGVEYVSESVKALSEVGNAVEKATETVTTIANSAQQQALSVESISDAMNQLDSTTRENSKLFQNTHAACQALTSTALANEELTQRFQIVEATKQAHQMPRAG